jgi:hypothetical protein
MRVASSIAQWVVRVTGVIQIVLGTLFWSGNALRLIPMHMLSGIVLVLALWTLALLAVSARVSPGLAGLALMWGLVVVVFGLNQAQVLAGPLHWIVQALHLLLGLGAIGLAENLALRIRRGVSDRRPAAMATGGAA